MKSSLHEDYYEKNAKQVNSISTFDVCHHDIWRAAVLSKFPLNDGHVSVKCDSNWLRHRRDAIDVQSFVIVSSTQWTRKTIIRARHSTHWNETINIVFGDYCVGRFHVRSASDQSWREKRRRKRWKTRRARRWHRGKTSTKICLRWNFTCFMNHNGVKCVNCVRIAKKILRNYSWQYFCCVCCCVIVEMPFWLLR